MPTERIDEAAAPRARISLPPAGAAGAPPPPPPLLTAKLAAAPPSGATLLRARLFELLDAAGPVTLVSAPAGWGKTVLLGSWYRTRAAEDGGGRAQARPPLGWLSLEPGDGGARLWSYLRAALHPAPAGSGPDAGPGPLGGFGPISGYEPLAGPGGIPGYEPGVGYGPNAGTGPGAGRGIPAEGFLEHLAEELARRSERATLILDDFHQVDDPDVPAGLDFLLRHSAGRLRLVIACRADPVLALHRRRLDGELTEIRAADLAFRADEVTELLTAHGIGLPAEQAHELLVRTEGWPAGLRFAALSLPGHPDPVRFVAEFAGDHPDVAGYLAEEVLAGLPADAREALCRASLVDRFSGGLVNALTDRTDGDQLLVELERRTGFVLALGTRPPAYRCHRMLGELLRAELGRRPPGDLADLHRRAAVWSAANDLPGDALRHALSAGDWKYAATVLTGHWPDLIPYRRGGPARPAPPAPPAEAVRADPELALAAAADRLDADDPAAALSYLRLASGSGDRLDGDRRDRYRLIHAALRLAAAHLAGDEPAVRAEAAGLLTLAGTEPAGQAEAGRDAAASGRAVARIVLGATRSGTGDLVEEEAQLTAGLADATRAGLSRAGRVCLSRLALVRAVRGELCAADRAARAALGGAPPAGAPRPADGAHAQLALALVALHRDRRDDAETNLTLAGTAAEHAGEPVLVALVGMVRAQLLRDRGDLSGAYQALGASRRRLADQPGARTLAHCFLAAEADLRAAHGEVETARDLLVAALDEGVPPVEPLAVALARVHLRAGDPRAAARAMPDWDAPAAERGWLLPVRLEAGLLDAWAARLAGDHRRAARTLERVLQLADPEGFRRVFTRADPPVRDLFAAHLDSGTAFWPVVNELLSAGAGAGAAGPEPAGAAAPLGEPLTERELTVLRYLQSILSNVEIATELSLSVNTIKTHVRNIYRKLDATRRRDAVRRARELNLI